MAKKLALFIFSMLAVVAAWGQSSVLSIGSWSKFSVGSEGIYKIDYAGLQNAGINPSQINPKNLRIYTGQPGMLPQTTNTSRVKDLVEIPIAVVGEADGKFDAGDYILFYGQGSDAFFYDTKSNFFSYQNNLFTDKNFYFLTISSSAGKRITDRANVAGSYPSINQYDDFAFYEADKYNLLHSGRKWYGELFDQTTTLTIQFDITGIVPGSPIKLTSHVMGRSFANCSFDVSYNNVPIFSQQLAAIPNESFGLKGSEAADTVSFSESSVSASTQSAQKVNYLFHKQGTLLSVGYLDYVLFSVKRKLAVYGNQTFFTSSESISNAISAFQINSASSAHLVWDVTVPTHVRNQAGQLTGSTFAFSTNTDSLKRFAVFDPTKVSAATFESVVANQNLHAVNTADLLIITHPSLLQQANRLAAHRQTHDQLTVTTTTTELIYNEYAGGKPDFTAIRDFVRDVYQKSNSQLKYVLLFGRGSYDYRYRVFENTNLVPIYESFESLNPLATYSSDDYFGFLEDNEGAWPESPAINYSMDVGVGRIPAKNLADAQTIVDKLIDYDTNPDRFGPWRKNFLFIADDGDNNIHENQADQLANNVEQNHSEFNAQKLFLDEYTQKMGPSGQVSIGANRELDLAMREGKAIINYTGHGSEQVLMQEKIVTPEIIEGWKNAPKYPLFVTATCEFGRNDDPFIISSAELLLLQKDGGAIGLVTTARPVFSNTNFQLNQAFYQGLFLKSNNCFRRLGDIMRDTKNNSINGVLNRNFSLLGDPSMKLTLPDNQVVPTLIKTLTGSDTLKALSRVSIKGEVQNNGTKISDFNGSVYATLFDKNQNLSTLGDPNETVTPPAPPYPFTERQSKLFQGSVSVSNGSFQFDFDMPTDLLPSIGPGKLSLYAYENNGNEATGFSTSFKVGGQEANPPVDTTPPEIKLYVSDTTFVAGGTVSSNTRLVARLSDVSGINISSADPSKSIVATLDNKWHYTLNDYYNCDINDVQKGTINYPLDTLKKGLHTLSLAASDTYGNQASVSINFNVTDDSGIVVGDFVNFPNPFSISSETTFRFTHTRAGEDLEATLTIYDLAGKPVAKVDYSVPTSGYQVDLGKWNGTSPDGTKFGPGIYIARLFVRSLADGSQNERAVKLIILN